MPLENRDTNDHDKIVQAFSDMNLIRAQIGRLEGIIESERGTLKRQREYLTEQIDKVEQEFRNIIYDSEKGLLIKIDRLTQESERWKSIKNNIAGLWLGLLTTVIGVILSWIFSRNK